MTSGRWITLLAALGALLLAIAAAWTLVAVTGEDTASWLERLSWAAQAVGSLIALPAIVLVLFQVSDIKRSLVQSSFESTSGRINELTQAMLSHADQLRELQTSGTLSLKAQILAEMVLDFMDTELLRSERFDDLWKDPLPSLKPWFLDLFREYPGLSATLVARQSWYSSDLMKLKRQVVP